MNSSEARDGGKVVKGGGGKWKDEKQRGKGREGKRKRMEGKENEGKAIVDRLSENRALL